MRTRKREPEPILLPVVTNRRSTRPSFAEAPTEIGIPFSSLVPYAVYECDGCGHICTSEQNYCGWCGHQLA